MNSNVDPVILNK